MQSGNRRHVGQCRDDPYGDPRCRHVGNPGSAAALRVHDIDPLGGNQAFQCAGAFPEQERIDGRVDERNPFAAGCRKLRNQRAILACNESARAGLP
jgi:hypothetical protein